MNVEKIDLTVNGEAKNPIEVILREGQAEQIFYPKKITCSGLIDSPYRYSGKVIDKTKAHVEYSVESLEIKLLVDPSDERGTEIKGKLSLNPDFVAFGINKNKFFSNSDLIKFVMSNAHCFEKLPDAKTLIDQLRNFDVKFEKSHIKTDDRKGTTENSVKEAIKFNKGEIGLNLNLKMPIHLGGPKIGIKVEIEIESRDSAPAFAFYSLELENTIRETAQSIMDSEITKLNSFVCIQLS